MTFVIRHTINTAMAPRTEARRHPRLDRLNRSPKRKQDGTKDQEKEVAAEPANRDSPVEQPTS